MPGVVRSHTHSYCIIQHLVPQPYLFAMIKTKKQFEREIPEQVGRIAISAGGHR